MDEHKIEPVDMQAALLSWYRVHCRSLPWRVPPGSGEAAETGPEPPSGGLGIGASRAYHGFVSEMMLQQTGVRTVLTYFPRFIERFPTLQALAQASLDDVLYVWQGLGYYRRARQLHAAANGVVQQGHWPVSRDAWERLPGVGPYSSAMLAVLINGAARGGHGRQYRARCCPAFELSSPASLAAQASFGAIGGTLAAKRECRFCPSSDGPGV